MAASRWGFASFHPPCLGFLSTTPAASEPEEDAMDAFAAMGAASGRVWLCSPFLTPASELRFLLIDRLLVPVDVSSGEAPEYTAILLVALLFSKNGSF